MLSLVFGFGLKKTNFGLLKTKYGDLQKKRLQKLTIEGSI